MFAQKILIFFFFSQIICFSKQEQSQKGFSYLRQTQSLKTYSPCAGIQNCEICEFSVCLKCADGRVLPNCNCSQGFIEVNGVCTKCPDNCQTCSSSSTCTTCNQQYTLNNGQCTCNDALSGTICSDPLNLTFNTFIGRDLISVQINFSDNIRISGIDESKQFQMLQSNCIILHQTTLANYGLAFNQQNAGCYINQNHQNQFIIVVGQQYDKVGILQTPKLVTNQILNYRNGQVKQIYSALTNQVGILNQLNQISKSCYFQNNQIEIGVPFTPSSSKTATIVNQSNLNVQCSLISNTQANPTLPFSCTQTQLKFDLKNFFKGTVITIQAVCTNIFQIVTNDQIQISLTDKDNQINILNISKLLSNYNFNSKIPFELSLTHTPSSSMLDFAVNINSYPQIFTPISVKPEIILYEFDIPPNSVTQDTYVELKVSVSNTQQTVQTVQYFWFNYQSYFQLSLLQKTPIINFDPSQSLTLNAQVIDSNYATTDTNLFSIQWVCFDTNNLPCQSSNGALIDLNSGYELDMPKNILSLNSNYNIYAIASRNSDFTNTQKAIISIYTIPAQLSYTIQNQLSPSSITVSYQDIISVYLDYTLNNTLINYTVRIFKDKYTMKSMYSNSSAISFSIQDYFPNLSFSINSLTELTLQFQAMDTYYQSTVASPTQLDVKIRNPPQQCGFGFSGSNNYKGFKDQITVFVNSCQFDSQYQPYTYQYFYYQNKTQLQQEIENPQIINRQELSLVQSSSQIITYFPPGNLTLMVVVQGQYSVQANFTSILEVKDINFDQSEYENFIQDQYSKAQQQQDQNQELINYRMISIAIQYYENKQPQYQQPENINTLKNNIIQRLQDASWSKLSQDVLLLSQKITSQISQSKIQMSPALAQIIKAQNEKTINDVSQEISNADQSTLTSSQKNNYQQILSNTLQSFVKSVNSINSWTAQDCQNMIDQTSKSLDGISQTMAVNQAPIIIQTIESVLTVEKLNYQNLLNKYYKGSSISGQTSGNKVTANYHVQMQTYPTSSHVYRNELSQINEQYQNKTSSQQILNLLNKTYPVIIPSIKTDVKPSRRRRFLTLYPAQLDVPMEIQFGQITAEEKLTCIQRSTSGKWVANSCKASVQVIDNQRQISCSCKKPDVTSLIADVEQLFDNENLKDIFDGDGIERLIHLTDWYKYAPIWTIIGLNIFLIVLVIVGCKLDKRDKLNIANKKYQLTKLEEIQQIKKSKSYLKDDIKKSQNLFIIVKNNEKIVEKLSQLETIKQSVYQETKENEKQENQLVKENGNQMIQTQQQFSNFQLDNEQIIHAASLENQDCEIQNLNELEKINNFDSKQQDRNTKSQNSKTSQANIETQQQCETNQITPTSQQYIQNPQPADDKQPHQHLDIDSIKFDCQQENSGEGEVRSKQVSLKNLVSNETPQNNQILIESQKELKIGSKSDQNLNSKQAFSIQEQLDNDQNQQQSNNCCKSEQHQLQSTIQNQLDGQTQQNISLKDDNMQQKNMSKKDLKKQQKEEEEKLKLQKAKEKLDDYLKLESLVKGIFAFHIFLSTFIIYDQKFSRAIRFIIYYNKMIWLLALNSVFGVNISVVQIIILSITSTIVLLIVTTILTALLSKKKLKIIGLIITFLFLLFCYYSILVVISGQNPQQANIWIGSYFLTLFINEYLIGIPICCLMYYTAKKLVSKVENPIILQIIGTGLLIEAFKN
ncbi:transmembrane protein, putative (macronuclear) [Tetrahymena thermophila SB210]|uniref:Transmembrane protein, putative n=1 Tax=Tetrahymena thermophila (strain SB210) TaxID=312017 RepID=I7LW18_TETTS|nr:transmembrane protein, putative [Tetrahymena thermophila SB210]EAS00590.2 transmembrane protein, putative [Tetrahymena thermophila SB210]|eukprot:XP_001020835.2 transmembrane protein, putative [Tetrahymena thermophila SB210]